MKLNRRQVLKAGLAASTVYSPWMLGIAQSKPVEYGVITAAPANPNLPLAQQGHEGSIEWNEYYQANRGPKDPLIDTIWESYNGDPSKGVEVLNRMLARKPEMVFLWGDGAGIAAALAPELKRLMLPFGTISFSKALVNPQNFPTAFITGPTYDEMLVTLVQEIKRQKSNARIAVVYVNSPVNTDSLPAIKAQAAKDGTQIVLEEATPLGINEAVAAAVAPKLVQANPDFVILHGFFRSGEGRIIKAARDQGLKAVFMGSYWSSEIESLIQLAGPANADGFIVANHSAMHTDNVPGIETIRKFRASKGKPAAPLSNEYLYYWRHSSMLVEAVRRADAAGKLTRAGMVEALESLSDHNAGGLFRDMKWNNHRLPYTRLYRLDAAGKKFDPISDWINFT